MYTVLGMTMALEQLYSRLGRASELKTIKERRLFRLFEILPGLLVWSTFVLLIAGSWLAPQLTSGILIAFIVFWFLRTIYFSVLLYSGYHKTKQSSQTDWDELLKSISFPLPQLPSLFSLNQLWHLVVIPTADESYEVLEKTLQAIKQSTYDKKRIMVVVGCEARYPKSAKEKQEQILKNFANVFAGLLVTVHPDNLPGEIKGKSANQAFATRQAIQQIIDPQKIPYEHVIVSVLDSDTRVSARFFSCLAYHYLNAQKPLRASFQPIPLYTNNIWQAPIISRILAFSTTFWQMIQQARPEALVTYSSQSLGLKPLAEIGFWQENIVSEDSRIYYQCHLNFNGDWQVIPLAITVSMDANVASTFWQTIKNIYKQQRRWAYGAENIPYLLYGYTKNKNISWRSKLNHALTMIEGFHSWNTHSIVLLVVGWLPILISPKDFSFTLLSYNLPKIAGLFMRIGMIGIIFTGYLSLTLMPKKNSPLSLRDKVGLILQWLLSPLSILLSTIPAIDASTRLMLGKYMGFWITPKGRI
jgi:cellulose synthase/poly-beta-1,6-N-acetylglucosamine synthase-like glycosyltransferase